MNILIVQSLETNLDIIKNAIQEVFGEILTEHIIYTDSFDGAVKLIPKSGKVLVVTSDWFHDEDKEGGFETKTIPHKSKNANTLAGWIKTINPKAKVVCYAHSFERERKSLVDCFVKKSKNMMDVEKDMIKIFKNPEISFSV